MEINLSTTKLPTNKIQGITRTEGKKIERVKDEIYLGQLISLNKLDRTILITWGEGVNNP